MLGRLHGQHKALAYTSVLSTLQSLEKVGRVRGRRPAGSSFLADRVRRLLAARSPAAALDRSRLTSACAVVAVAAG